MLLELIDMLLTYCMMLFSLLFYLLRSSNLSPNPTAAPETPYPQSWQMAMTTITVGPEKRKLISSLFPLEAVENFYKKEIDKQ